MRRIAGFIFIFIIVASVSCSSKKKYSDIRAFINEVITTQDEFISGIDKSLSADDVVYALDTFGVKIIKLSDKSMEIKKKYPDIDKWVNDPSFELKLDFEKLNDAESKFGKVFVGEKMKILIKEKKVQYSLIDLNKKMENVKFFQ